MVVTCTWYYLISYTSEMGLPATS